MNRLNRRKDDELIGRMDERLKGLDDIVKTHVKDDQEKFEVAFRCMSDGFDKMEIRFDKMETKMGTLWDTSNRNQGAFSASRLLINCVWGVVVLIASYYLNKGTA